MTSSDKESLSRLSLARTIAREAGDLTLTFFQQKNFDVEKKTDDSPVTVADRNAEQLLRTHIAESFPEDGIMGEEFSEQQGSSGYRWILDPIDGTNSFISGVPLYGTLVAVEHEKISLLGVIHIPALNESIYAARGHGAWHVKGELEPCPARVSDQKELADSLLLTSQVDCFKKRGATEAYQLLEDTTRITRTWGDCYGYLLVATGRAEVMIDAEMAVWDAAAIQPVIEEAGGTFTDWQGKPGIYSGDGIGTNKHLLEQVLAVTRSFPKASAAH
jgi:histidinol-phosphatase